MSLYEPEVHVPLLIFAPGAPKGKAVTQPVSLRDLAATVADLIGRGTDHPFPGRSLAGRWSGAAVPNDPIIVEVEQQTKFSPTPTIPASLGPMRGLILGSWVYIRGGDGERLFDLARDPKQARDLVGSSEVEPILLDLRANLDGLERGDRTLEPSRIARDLAPRARRGFGMTRAETPRRA